uniref:Secreted protein n=1 Tax=Peronospora matthiolae TaxID=2874970 RepID=A0AAV1T4P5_9STRA
MMRLLLIRSRVSGPTLFVAQTNPALNGCVYVFVRRVQVPVELPEVDGKLFATCSCFVPLSDSQWYVDLQQCVLLAECNEFAVLKT